MTSSRLNFRTKPHPVLNGRYRHLEVLLPDTTGDDAAGGGVTIVALNRPEKRNALNARMWKEVGDVFENAGTIGDGCRCILLAGIGPDFCSGIDVSDPTFLPAATNSDDVAHVGLTFQSKLSEMQECFTNLESKCPVPVVAAVQGRCLGAGIDLITCADIRVASSDATFSVREVAMGLAADVGTLQRLPKIAGNASAVSELCLTGRDFTANEARELGLVSQVVDDDPSDLLSEALRICSSIAQHSPVAVRGTKRALLYARDHAVADGLKQIADYSSLALQGRDLAVAWKQQRRKNKLGKGNSKKPLNFADLPAYSKL